MVKDVRIGKEIVIAVEDKPGVLAGISSLIADHGISITAITASGAGGSSSRSCALTVLACWIQSSWVHCSRRSHPLGKYQG